MTEPAFFDSLWRAVKRLDHAKVNSPSLALRNALAVGLPLGAGIELGHPLAGAAIAIGALNVSYSDDRDPYLQRAKRMFIWCLLGALAVFVGDLAGKYHLLGILVSTAWAFGAGMMLSLGIPAGDLGLNTLVTVVVFAARGDHTLIYALDSGLLVFAGGLVQIAFAILFWPLQRNKPERMVVGQAYVQLAGEIAGANDSNAFAPVVTPAPNVQRTIDALGRDRSLDGERFRLLFDQTDRLRLSVFLLKRLRDALGEQTDDLNKHAAADLTEYLNKTAHLLDVVGAGLKFGQFTSDFNQLVESLHSLADRIQTRKADPAVILGTKTAQALDIVSGQLRLVAQLAQHTTEAGSREFMAAQQARPWKLRPMNWRATFRANFTWTSQIFRHAVRLSLCVALASLIELEVSWRRAYWLPMTVAVVLKPDFTTTFSRGVLRLMGTLAGLFLATMIYILLPESSWTQLLLVASFAFFLRYLGPANYGIFSVAISGLIVFLLAASGVAPGDVVTSRALNTTAGGIFALIAYALWPTWERNTIAESLAQMIDAHRAYFSAIVSRATAPQEDGDSDKQLTLWRLKRSAAEAAFDRVSAEPRITQEKIQVLNSVMASSYVAAQATMGIDAGLVGVHVDKIPESFQAFAHDLDFILYFLSNALHGSQYAQTNLPQLREDHRRMIESRGSLFGDDQFLLNETDRLTVSVNTLREQIMRFVAAN